MESTMEAIRGCTRDCMRNCTEKGAIYGYENEYRSKHTGTENEQALEVLRWRLSCEDGAAYGLYPPAQIHS